MDAHYRVAIFGSARTQEGDETYENIYRIARGLAGFGFDIVTGGGPGIMKAANAGHKSIRSNAHSIGLKINLPFEQEANKYLDIKKNFDRFSSRLDTFMTLSDAVIVAPGGVGTLLEFFYCWQLMQVQHICETPIILFGDIWKTLLDWLRDEVMEKGYFDLKDMALLFHASTVQAVIDIILKVHKDRNGLQHVCTNYEKYRVEMG